MPSDPAYKKNSTVGVSSSYQQNVGFRVLFLCQKKAHGCVFIWFLLLFFSPKRSEPIALEDLAGAHSNRSLVLLSSYRKDSKTTSPPPPFRWHFNRIFEIAVWFRISERTNKYIFWDNSPLLDFYAKVWLFVKIKYFVVMNCSKERPGSVVNETLQNGILIVIDTSKELNLYDDLKYTSLIKFSLTHQKLRAWENFPYFRK